MTSFSLRDVVLTAALSLNTTSVYAGPVVDPCPTCGHEIVSSGNGVTGISLDHQSQQSDAIITTVTPPPALAARMHQAIASAKETGLEGALSNAATPSVSGVHHAPADLPTVPAHEDTTAYANGELKKLGLGGN